MVCSIENFMKGSNMSRLDIVLRENILPEYNKSNNDLIDADTFMDKLNRISLNPTESELEIWREIFEEDKVKIYGCRCGCR